MELSYIEVVKGDNKWRKWILECINLATSFVFVNGKK